MIFDHEFGAEGENERNISCSSSDTDVDVSDKDTDCAFVKKSWWRRLGTEETKV